jgi:thiosulfate/3-mercaptopyruvate sulfurtransferase
MYHLGLIALAVSLAPRAVDSEPSSALPKLVTFDEIQKRLDQPTVRLLDVRTKADYTKSHIPGAVWIDPNAVQKLASRPGGLTDRDAWSQWVAPLGIGSKTEIFVYDANRQLNAARVWWLLRYLGVDNVGLINGGYPLWEREKRPVSTEFPKVEPQSFRVAFRGDRSATRADVLAILKQPGSTRVVDARSDDEFTGVEAKSKRGGRIPTSCHLEWATLVDKDGRFLDESALRAKISASGIKPGEAVITHCQGGGRASVDAFVFERLGFPARNYYPGWSDWGNADDTPVVTGKDAKVNTSPR